MDKKILVKSECDRVRPLRPQWVKPKDIEKMLAKKKGYKSSDHFRKGFYVLKPKKEYYAEWWRMHFDGWDG